MNQIHETAVVEPGAELEGVTVGPYCVVRSGVKIGSGTTLVAHVYIEGKTTIGQDNVIYPFASIGMRPQDLKYHGENSTVVIGDRNHIRESATIHRGTEQGRMETRIGNDCLLMAYSHVAHDCLVEDYVILANSSTLAGHVSVYSHATLGGLTAVHQFSRIGAYAFLSGGTMVGLDVPPYCIAEGRRGGLVGINSVGLKRAGFSQERMSAIKRAYREFFKQGGTVEEACLLLEQEKQPDVQLFIDFVRHSQRGITRPLWNDLQES